MRTITLALLLTACGAATEETDLETAFCALLAEGDTVEVGADEEAAHEDARAVITLDPDQPTRVRYTPDEPGSFAFGLSQDVPFAVLKDGEALPITATIQGASCPDLAVRHTVELAVESYVIELGPGEGDVSLVSEESDDDE